MDVDGPDPDPLGPAQVVRVGRDQDDLLGLELDQLEALLVGLRLGLVAPEQLAGEEHVEAETRVSGEVQLQAGRPVRMDEDLEAEFLADPANGLRDFGPGWLRVPGGDQLCGEVGREEVVVLGELAVQHDLEGPR